MKKYEITVSKSALKELQKLPKEANNKIIPSISKLANNPRPTGSKKLKGSNSNWRIRVGNYRIIYAIDDEILIVDIRKIGHRRDIYD